jgi:hypothetical protein
MVFASVVPVLPSVVLASEGHAWQHGTVVSQ